MRGKTEARERLDALVRGAGGRATPARAAVLGLLRTAPQPLSHREVEHALAAAGHAFDRVTLYRALEWLEANGLAHKVAGEDRIWRFRGTDAAHREHAHFQCRSCGSTVCLDDVPPPRAKAPRGYRVEGAALTLRGLCPNCRDH
jgi:Fur family ferric uptake transcriptional regulator